MLLLYFLIQCIFNLCDSHGTPMYTYIRELCPPGLQPLTGVRHVRTCDDKCPRGSTCIQGVCCLKQPSCNHFTYKYPSKYSCLPRVKQNCPEGYKCVPSTQEGMHICCSSKPPRVARVPPEQAVCPASHPVISNDRQHLRLCSQCQNGVCTPFRSSDVSVCCHSSTAFCGPGSSVEMDGLLARDCSKLPCSEGYECSLAPSGSRVCCSLAACSNGQRARAVCAAGCRRDESCEVINGQRWCCPAVRKLCPGGRTSNGNQCTPTSSACDDGFECIASESGDGYLCCQVPEQKNTLAGVKKARTFSTRSPEIPPANTVMPVSVTSEFIPRCGQDNLPLLMDGEYLRCPQLNAPCPKAGYTCQIGNGGLYCCPLDVEIDMVEETTTPPSVSLRKIRPEKPCKGCGSKETSTTTSATTTTATTTTESPIPKCPFAFREARIEITDEIKTCIGFLDFS